jgi:hypothetical protein
MRIVQVTRDGEIKLTVPAEIRNGVLRHGQAILINGDLVRAPWTKETVAAAIKTGRITAEIEAMGMRIGDNGNGLVVRWLDEVQAEERAQAQAAYDALPGEVRAAREERAAIDKLYRRAHQSLNHDTDDNNLMRGYSLRAEADQRLAAWRKQYPEAAKEERRAALLAQAEHEESLAVGALTYDCDGSFSPEYQRQRHDEMMAKAAALRRQAEEL